MRKVLILIVCMVAFMQISFAQRTMPGQFFLDASAKSTFSPSAGCEIRFGQYFAHGGLWTAGVDFSDRVYASSNTKARYNVSDLFAFGEYLYRFWGTRDRSFNMYAGAGFFLGVQFTDLFGRLQGGEWPVKADGKYIASPEFVLGLRPRLEVEWFFWNRLALIGFGSARANILSPYSLFTFDAGVGLRYNF